MNRTELEKRLRRRRRRSRLVPIGSEHGELHREAPSRRWRPMLQDPLHRDIHPTDGLPEEIWHNDVYYASVVRFASGWFVGGGPYVRIGVSSHDETARHDWRDLQRIKNDIVGAEWEAVELYPAESRLIDPSNRFYLFCVPRGVLAFGWDHRRVWTARRAVAAQRPFDNEAQDG